MQPIHVIGMGISPDDLSERRSLIIAGADVLVAGERLLEKFRSHPGLKLAIKAPLEKVFERMGKERAAGKKVVVLAEGDPGFFGIGRRLLRHFEKEPLLFHPNVTALQSAASKMRKPWEGISAVSLHGRKDLGPLLRALVRCDSIGVFTDRIHTPSRIAEEMIGRGADAFRMWVFEDMGEESEKCGCYELERARTLTFSPLNLVILERTRAPLISLRLGMDDDRYVHESGLITKKEVRAIGLAALQIEPRHLVWDVGAGCGSVGIEASILASEGTVYALEKNGARVEMIRENIRRTGAYTVQVIHGETLGAMENLPAPDRIFMGGGLGAGEGLMDAALSRLKPGGRMVLHVVLLRSLELVRNLIRSRAWDYELLQVQVSRSRDLAGDERFESLNPVYIVSIRKPAELESHG